MTAQLNKELTAALHATGDNELEVVDPETQRTYFLIDSETHRQAMDALRRQQDRGAIAEGLAQMEAAQVKPLDQAFSDMQSRLGARFIDSATSGKPQIQRGLVLAQPCVRR